MDPLPDRKRQALAILQDADRALQGWTCDASTECCRFSVTGREPWVTQVEWELVADELKRSGRRLKPLAGEHEEADGRCPLLDDAGRCMVYAARPLGCRTFYCERAHGPAVPSRQALRGLARRLDDLTVAQRHHDTGARPLRSWIGSERTAARGRRGQRGAR